MPDNLFSDSTDGEAFVARYEELRSRALGDDSAEDRGFVLFARRGMVAWMKAWSGCEQKIERATVPGVKSAPVSLPPGLHAEIATMLATMAMSAGNAAAVRN